MQGSKGGILAHKNGASRKALWLAAAASLPCFGVVAAFGVAPDTLVEKLEVRRVSQEVTLPKIITLDTGTEATFVQEGRVQRGDTVAALLARLDVDDPDAAGFLRRSKEARALGQLRPGRSVRAETSADGEMLSLSFLTPSGNLFRIEREDDTFKVSEQPAEFELRSQMATGEIRSSLFAATDAAGLAESVAVQIAEIFSSHVDFHRDLRRGDRFAVVYQSFHHDGELVKTGRVLAAEFVNQGKTYQAVWFQAVNGQGGGYYTPDGKGMRKAFLRSPLEFSRISSGFSLARFHPILQQWTAHRGIDYAAPTGTRVRSTADGVVSFTGWQGGYGNLVVVQHPGKYTTYYAHLSGYAAGVRKGVRVAQGDYLGSVGQTGMATGPHLHYEFHISGVQHDPLRIVLPEAVPITRELRAAFDTYANPLAHQLGLLRSVRVARLD